MKLPKILILAIVMYGGSQLLGWLASRFIPLGVALHLFPAAICLCLATLMVCLCAKGSQHGD